MRKQPYQDQGRSLLFLMGFRRIRLILMLRMIEGECGLQTQSSMNCKIMINNLLLFNLAVLDFSDDILR